MTDGDHDGGPMRRPRRPHEPTELRLIVRRSPEGGLLLSTPMTPGWCVPAGTPGELARGIEQAFTECALAAYARLRGALYDLAETEEVIPPEAYAAGALHPAEPEPAEPAPVDEVAQRRRKKHPRTHEPTDWTLLDDGAVLSPKGRRYSPDTPHARRVLVARGRL